MKNTTIFIALLFLIGCTTEVEYIPIPQRPIPTELMNEKENAMVVITNQARVSIGLQKYKTSLSLYHIAKNRVLNMVEKDSLSHNGFYSSYLFSGALYYGESVSYGYLTAESNVQAFRISADHWPMFISSVYEYIAIACVNEYAVVLVARWRNYNGKKELEIREVTNGNISTIEINYQP